MALSQPQLKKRALVVAILAIAAVCNVHVDVQRESPDADVIRAFRKVMLKAHPDKGGSTADAQRLQGARAAWEDACSRAPKGRPKTGHRQQERQPRGQRTGAAVSPKTILPLMLLQALVYPTR